MSTDKTYQDYEMEELFAKAERGEELTEQEINAIKYQENKEEKVALDKIVRGINDTFVKDYKFEDYGGLQLTVKIKAPNAIEQGRIHQIRERYLGGTGTMVNSFTYLVYHTFGLLEVCGMDVPVELKPENVYNMNVIYKIGVDFADWLDRFQY